MNIKQVVTALFLCLTTTLAAQDSELKFMFPVASDLSGWAKTGEVNNYGPDDLFALINGGADIFLEYGFEEVYTENYLNDGNTIRAEIYKMSSDSAAFGIFSSKRAGEYNIENLPHTAISSDYYYSFWKSNYYIIVTAYQNNELSQQGIEEVAKLINDKITETGSIPKVCNLLPSEGLSKDGVKFMNGNIAFGNYYYFTYKDIFKFKCGAVGVYGDNKKMVLEYASQDNAQTSFKEVIAFMEGSTKFLEKEINSDLITCKDKKSNQLKISQTDNLIYIDISKVIQ